jgi:hypothetical protein
MWKFWAVLAVAMENIPELAFVVVPLMLLMLAL